jgi:hypothetical protein
MPAAALAVPAIASIASSYFGRANQGQSAAGGQLQQNAATQAGIGGPALGQAAGYFGKLAGGNRATMTQALSPEISSINSVYGGTARTLGRFLRGPEKDVAMAGAEQQRAGQIGSLFSTARPQANAALAGIGQSAFGGSTAAAGGAGGVFGQQAGQLQGGLFGNAALMGEAGKGFGSLFMQLLQASRNKGGNSGVSGLFSQDPSGSSSG